LFEIKETFFAKCHILKDGNTIPAVELAKTSDADKEECHEKCNERLDCYAFQFGNVSGCFLFGQQDFVNAGPQIGVANEAECFTRNTNDQCETEIAQQDVEGEINTNLQNCNLALDTTYLLEYSIQQTAITFYERSAEFSLTT